MAELTGYKEVVWYVKDVEVEDKLLGMYELALPDYLARVMVDDIDGVMSIVGDVEYFNVPEIKWMPVEADTETLRACIIQLIEKFEMERKG